MSHDLTFYIQLKILYQLKVPRRRRKNHCASYSMPLKISSHSGKEAERDLLIPFGRDGKYQGACR
jgi:hypothetical protein